MKVIIEGQLLSIFRAPDFTDKETGEVTMGKHKLQLLVESELANGEIKQEVKDISIPSKQLKEYEDKVGKPIQLKCDFISKSSVNFYVK